MSEKLSDENILSKLDYDLVLYNSKLDANDYHKLHLHNTALLEKISELERRASDAGREWISVKDRLPEEDIPVYVYTNSLKLSTGLVRKGVWYYADETEDLTYSEEYNTAWSFHRVPNRWMPLPPPPADKE